MINGEIWYDTDGQPIQAHGGGILEYNGIYYWYGECYEQINGESEYSNSGVMCYSSKDLLNWKNEGMVLSAITTRDWCEHELYYKNVIQRPKVVFNENTKKFMMYFHSDNPMYTRSTVGFAESDTPTGKFHYLGSIRPHYRPSHDLTVFSDNGHTYLFNASDHNSTVRAIKMSEDSLHFGKYSVVTMEEPCMATREAPAVFERNGKYYMISSGCSGWNPNRSECHVANSILGEWKSLGDPCVGEGSELTFRSQSTFVLKIGEKYIYMGDRWNPEALNQSGYVWLEITFENDKPVISWNNEWKGV